MNREYIEAQEQKDAARREAEAAGLDPDARPRKPRSTAQRALARSRPSGRPPLQTPAHLPRAAP